MIDWKRHSVETATLVLAAALCALVSNAFASRERKVPLVGSYPNATTFAKKPEAPPAGIAPSAAASEPTPAPADPALAPPGPAPSKSEPAKSAERATTAAAPKRTAPPSAASAEPTGEAALLARFPPHNTPYVETDGASAAWLHARGALFLDARRTKVFEEGHVAGARAMSVWEADVNDKVTALVGEGRRVELPIVIYCSGGACEDSHMLAERLFGVGFTNVLVYKDGFPDWQSRGGAVRVGPAS